MKHNHQKIEKKWQKYWQTEKINEVDLAKAKKPFYNLMMFPYPSAEGLHVGNMYAFVHSDAYGRFMRLRGFDVFEPIGLDGFGIHSENYAIKMKENILDVSKRTEKHFYEQLHLIGNQYDWSRHLETYKPDYYKWTQWIFVQLFKKGLAYQAESYVNWCPSCKTVLSDEQVVSGECERCGSVAERKLMRQWFFKITDYAERLLKNLECLPAGALGPNVEITEKMAKTGIDWTERTKTAQRDWIGKSEGAQFRMEIADGGQLSAKYERILLASNNLSKKARPEELLKANGIKTQILTPKDLKLKEREAKEEGSLFENAKEKAELYRDKTDLPILGIDTGFFVEGEEIDPVKVKRNALKGKNERNLSQEEIGKLMHEYYRDIARKRGGQVEAYWQDVFALSLPDKETEIIENKREVTLTDQVKGKIDIYFPLRSLYISKATGKYISEQNHEEEMMELAPYAQSLKKLLGGNGMNSLEVFTTRLDTVFGMTFALIAPEHELIRNLESRIKNWGEVKKYIDAAKKKSELQRMAEIKEKTGVELKGIKIINPFTKKAIPLFVSDFVLAHYGTGAVMAVPAHDQRDYEFAKKFKLPIKMVICPNYPEPVCPILGAAFIEDGHLVDSAEFTGLTSIEARKKMAEHLQKEGIGKKTINYKLRDWCISRQRYWGPPIPMIYCANDGWQPVPEKELPVLLPKTDDYLPKNDGLAPLARNEKFIKTKCPKCGGPARRETDVSDTFLDSAWYYFKYPSTDMKQVPFDPTITKKWLPVDMYIGGQEHAVLHLLYSRFITMAFHDLGLIDFEEPYKRFFAHGLLIKDGAKMSKSKGNVINPDEYIKKFGADSIRLYLMFLGDVRVGGDWRDSGIIGMSRFINRVWTIAQQIIKTKTKRTTQPEILKVAHQTVKRVGEDLEKLKFNTAIAAIMEFVNALYGFSAAKEKIGTDTIEILTKLIAPFAPHLAEELWAQLGNKKSIFTSPWPVYNPALVKEETIELVVQINGKVRARLSAPADIPEAEAKNLSLSDDGIKKWLNGKEPKKVIFVKGRLINIVI